MAANGWKRVLVFEDDVLPRYNDLKYLPSALAELPTDWELLYLGYLKHEKISFSLKSKQFFYKIISFLKLMKWDYTMVSNLLPKHYSKYLKKAGMHDCTHAYAITLSAAKKLLEEQTPVAHRADDLLSYLTLKGRLYSFVTEPKFFDQEWFNNPDAISVKTI
jgi:glycosyl transferase family 25